MESVTKDSNYRIIHCDTDSMVGINLGGITNNLNQSFNTYNLSVQYPQLQKESKKIILLGAGYPIFLSICLHPHFELVSFIYRYFIKLKLRFIFEHL